MRAKYDVSEGGNGRATSKVDLAEAVDSTGVGSILGVGISGLVQVRSGPGRPFFFRGGEANGVPSARTVSSSHRKMTLVRVYLDLVCIR